MSNSVRAVLYSTVYHLALPQALRAASLTTVAQVVLVLICALMIDRTGRKYWMMGAFGLGAVTLGILGLGVAKDVSWFIVLGPLSYGLIGSIAAVVYLYTPEIYPTRMRAVGTGVATSWLRVASAIGPTLIGFMLARRRRRFGILDVRGGGDHWTDCRNPHGRDAKSAARTNFALILNPFN